MIAGRDRLSSMNREGLVVNRWAEIEEEEEIGRWRTAGLWLMITGEEELPMGDLLPWKEEEEIEIERIEDPCVEDRPEMTLVHLFILFFVVS